MAKPQKILRFFTWLLSGLIIIPVALFTIGILVIYSQQDRIIRSQMGTVNDLFAGRVDFFDSHISPFERFPYISIEIDSLKVFESKSELEGPILNIGETYFGFDILNIIKGNYEVKSIELVGGEIHIIQDSAGALNILKAFETSPDSNATEEEPLHLDIQKIEIKNVHVTHHNLADGLHVDAQINSAISKFKTSQGHIKFSLISIFNLGIAQGKEPTLIHNKDFETDIELDYLEESQVVLVKPSKIKLDHGEFDLVGKVDIDNDLDLDLRIYGKKPNFDLLFALAPEDVSRSLVKYRNAGNIYFDARIKGKAAGEALPFIEADFGCEEAFIQNSGNQKKVEDLFFKGHFTNGEKRDLSTMEFSIVDFSAKPEAGEFKGFLKVKNFDSPEIDMKLDSKFNLDFLAKFFNLDDLEGLHGEVDLSMNFRDIIDLDQPERSLEKLNQSYFTRLEIKDLGFKSPDFHLPFENLNLLATVEGREAKIEYFNALIGNSDISIKAGISDLPALLHQSSEEISSSLEISSKHIDLLELSSGDTSQSKPLNETIDNFNVKLSLVSAANTFATSNSLPIGKFYIDDLQAQFKQYPHRIHGFQADVVIEPASMRVVNFSGAIDSTNLKMAGICKNYDLWFADEKNGTSKLFYFIDSDLLKLKDLFTYEGVNYVPEEYRHEEFKDFKLNGYATLKYKDELEYADIFIQYIKATMKVHPLRLERFGGRMRLTKGYLKLDNVNAKLGNSQFVANMTYNLSKEKEDGAVKNHFEFSSKYLNFDQLMKYRPPPPTNQSNTKSHEEAWSIYQIPFPNMSYDFKIDHMHYKKNSIENLEAKLRTKDNQTLYVDQFDFETTGGSMKIQGNLIGLSPTSLSFIPNIELTNIDLDKMLYRFENFGQDHLVSENLIGKLSGKITGNIKMYPDMVPKIDESDILMEMEVTGGRLEHYSALDVMADYFKDKNLAKIIFDTLENSIEMKKGELIIPKMTINSSLGFIELSGKQDLDLNMEYYMRIPLKLVSKAAWSKLFKKKKDVDDEQLDEIEYQNEDKKIRYLNIKISGTPDDYDISLKKDKRG